jgi:nucleoside-diphosphate-sugar epimerase
MDSVLVTGGAGYIGTLACRELSSRGWSVRALDALLFGQQEIVDDLRTAGVEVIEGDVRDERARAQALSGVRAVVHLAAIVGDPACARDPETSQAVNVDATRELIREAEAAGVEHFIFASTCSNYGKMTDPAIPIDEGGALAPVSRYAEQKVSIEQLLDPGNGTGLASTRLRFATVYGVAPRMRFDLTVNEFTRDLWADRELEVFGTQRWRPYIHVHDAARAIADVLAAPRDQVIGEVFNVGSSDENYTKADIVEAIQQRCERGTVTTVEQETDPRDYRVSFEKVRSVLGFVPAMTVPQGIDELLEALEHGAFGDPFAGRYRNTP